MHEENSFFFTPFVFFGPTENIEDVLEQIDEEWNYSDSWNISFQTDFSHLQQQRIGLFLHWYDLNE